MIKIEIRRSWLRARWVDGFLLFAGGILALAGAAKMYALMSGTTMLDLQDPVLGVRLRHLLLAVGAMELFVAGSCLFSGKWRLSLGLVLWVNLNFLVYLAGLWSMGGHLPYLWFHSPVSLLDVSPRLADTFAGLVAVLFLIGGSTALWIGRKEPSIVGRTEPTQSEKMSCPACGGHIRFAVSNVDQEIACPHCRAMVTLRHLDKLKMGCVFCHGHIEFPAHAAGTKMPCPHCRREITLKLSSATVPT
jgi:hypothetical protein